MEPPTRAARAVLVTGAPGSGKSTLARLLARELRVPMLARDDVRGGLFMTAGAWDDALERVPSSDEAVEVFLRTAEGLLAAGVSCVLEYVIRRQRPADLDRLVAAGLAAVVVTRCDDPMSRFRDRNRSDRLVARPAVLRALGHESVADHTDAASARMAMVAGEMRTDFPLPTLHVDTTSGYHPHLDEIIGFATRSPAWRHGTTTG